MITREPSTASPISPERSGRGPRRPSPGPTPLSQNPRRLALAVGLVAALTTANPIVAQAADLEAGRQKAAPCAACHGSEGNATIPGTPSLAGQPVYFTHWQLIKFRDGRRKDPQMSPF